MAVLGGIAAWPCMAKDQAVARVAWGMRGKITCDIQRRWTPSSCPSTTSSGKRGIDSSTGVGIRDVLGLARVPFGVPYLVEYGEQLVRTVVTMITIFQAKVENAEECRPSFILSKT